MYFFIFFIFINLIIPDDNISQKDIELLRENNYIKLDSVVIQQKQMDSLMMNITTNLYKASNECFYITFMKYKDTCYFEILEDVSNEYLFKIKENHPRSIYNRKIYGYSRYNNINFYLLLYSVPYNLEENELSSFFYKTNKKKIIYRNIYDSLFIFENPMWLYQYTEKEIKLIKSINDN